jgi:hypothetical protein
VATLVFTSTGLGGADFDHAQPAGRVRACTGGVEAVLDSPVALRGALAIVFTGGDCDDLLWFG